MATLAILGNWVLTLALLAVAFLGGGFGLLGAGISLTGRERFRLQWTRGAVPSMIVLAAGAYGVFDLVRSGGPWRFAPVAGIVIAALLLAPVLSLIWTETPDFGRRGGRRDEGDAGVPARLVPDAPVRAGGTAWPR